MARGGIVSSIIRRRGKASVIVGRNVSIIIRSICDVDRSRYVMPYAVYFPLASIQTVEKAV